MSIVATVAHLSYTAELLSTFHSKGGAMTFLYIADIVLIFNYIAR